MRSVVCFFVLLARRSEAYALCVYNVLEGGKNLRSIFDQIFSRCEIVIVNEANGWYKQHRQEIYGFNMELLRTSFGYDIAVLAKASLMLERGVLTTEHNQDHIFHHGLLHCTINQEVHILATHLSPHSSTRRRLEARAIMDLIYTASLHETALVIAGDLNSLSPFDSYSPEVVQVLRRNSKLHSKFLLANGTIDYEPMRILLAEFQDLADSTPTVPTKLHADELHAVSMRLDYILLNHHARTYFKPHHQSKLRVRTHINNFTDTASDHYPIVLEAITHDSTVQGQCSRLDTFSDAVLALSQSSSISTSSEGNLLLYSN